MGFKNTNNRILQTEKLDFTDFLFSNGRGGFAKEECPSIPAANGRRNTSKNINSRDRTIIMKTTGWGVEQRGRLPIKTL